MSNANVLIEKIQKRREFKVELDNDGHSVTLRRPPEVEWRREFDFDFICRYAVGWEGFTESDLYAGGGSDEVEFHSALWREVLSDRSDWVGKCAAELVAAITKHAEERKAASGN